MIKPDNVIVGWRAWYWINAQIVTFDSETTAWVDLPESGVQSFVFYHKTRPYKNLRVGGDYYWRDPVTGIISCCLESENLVPQWAKDQGLVKLGLEIAAVEYNKCATAAHQAREAPDETGRIDKIRA